MTSNTETTEPVMMDVSDEEFNRVEFAWALVKVVMLVLSEDVKLKISVIGF